MTSGRSVLAGGKFGGLLQLRPGLNNELHGGSAVSALDGFATVQNSVGRAQMPRGEKQNSQLGWQLMRGRGGTRRLGLYSRGWAIEDCPGHEATADCRGKCNR